MALWYRRFEVNQSDWSLRGRDASDVWRSAPLMTKTHTKAAFEENEGGEKQPGKINWQKKPMPTLPDAETSARAGPVQTLTQSGHKVKPWGFGPGRLAVPWSSAKTPSGARRIITAASGRAVHYLNAVSLVTCPSLPEILMFSSWERKSRTLIENKQVVVNQKTALKGYMQEKHPEERRNYWDEKHLGLPQLLLNTWKLILVYSVAISKAFTTGRPCVTADNRPCWFFHNAHTGTGNELLSETPIHIRDRRKIFDDREKSWRVFPAMQEKSSPEQACNLVLSPYKSALQCHTVNTGFLSPHRICRTQMVIRTQIWPLCRLCHF